jgi:hypothetical protein
MASDGDTLQRGMACTARCGDRSVHVSIGDQQGANHQLVAARRSQLPMRKHRAQMHRS